MIPTTYQPIDFFILYLRSVDMPYHKILAVLKVNSITEITDFQEAERKIAQAYSLLE